MQDGRLRRKRPERIDDGGTRPVRDVDQLERVLGAGSGRRDDDRHRLADIAHTVDRDRPAFHRRLHADDEAAVKSALTCSPGEDGGNAGQCCAASVSIAEDIGMGVRRAQDRRVQRARPDAEIVDETAATG